jgi:hypothetical protein
MSSCSASSTEWTLSAVPTGVFMLVGDGILADEFLVGRFKRLGYDLGMASVFVTHTLALSKGGSEDQKAVSYLLLPQRSSSCWRACTYSYTSSYPPRGVWMNWRWR